MELKRYKQQIRDHLIGDIAKNSQRQAQIAGGALRHTDDLDRNYEELMKSMSKFKGSVLTQMKDQYPSSNYVQKGGFMDDTYTDEGGDCCVTPMKLAPKKVSKRVEKIVQPVDQGGDMSSDDEEFTGGKFNFVKSMKHIGHDIGEGTKKVAVGLIAKEAGTQLAKGVSYGAKAIANGASSLVASAPEALPIAEESAPLLMACGMKKPKRTRKLSQKEVNRHALIRKLMSQHKCSLAEASKHIKENNIQY